MKSNKTSKIALRLEEEEKQLLFYYASKLGLTPSALIRNQIKKMLQDLEEQLADKHILNITNSSLVTGPNFTQEEIEDLFEINHD